MPASTPNLAAAQRIAERFAALTDAQRRAAYAKMQAEGLQMAQFPVPRRQAGTDGAAACALSHAQERQWFLWQLEPQGSAYHMAETLRLQGPLDEAALRAAFHALVARHAALRTVFRPGEDGLPQQLVQPAQALDIQLWAHDGDTPDSDAVQARLHTLVHTPFDLAQGPLLRVALVRLGAQDHVLAVVMHHIVSDGRSLQILVAEFAELYQSGCAGQAAALKPLPVTYADYALWQRQWLAAGEKERQLAYWRAQLGDEHPVLQLPTDHPRRADGRYTAAQHELDLPQALVQGLRRQAQQQGGTLFMALLAGLQALLYRHTGEADMRVGVPIANRHRSETEGVVGFFVNTQVLRSQLHDGLPLQALLAQAIEASLGAQDHQDLPFEQLVEALQPERSLGSSPLFQVLLNHQRQSATASAQAIAGLQVQSLAPAAPAALFELMLDVAEDEAGQPRLKFVYARELFEPASIARMAGHYLALLQALVDAPAQALGRVPLLGAAEQAQLRQWRQPLLQDAPVAPLHELIEAQAQRQPAAIALTLGDAHVSYAELNQRANRVAHQLIARGVGPECKVGLAVERSIELVVGLLAILKAGGAYVPLDPDYPAERLAYMVEDSGLALLLSTSALRDKVPVPATLPVLCLDAPSPLLADAHAHNPARAAHVDQLAYVIYTSGSTGRPKGAQLSHRHVARLLSATAPWFGFGPQDVWTLFHSYAFDFSVWEIFGALCTGGRLVVVPYWVSRSPADFMALLRSEQVTVLNQTPSAFQQLVHLPEEEGAAPLALRQVIFGGEALEPESLRPWFDRHGDETPRLVNMYGITETTVHVTYRPITRADLADLAGGRSPVGRAIPDLGLQVLDAALNPLPVGVPGELHVSGAGLARGYLGRPGLSAERFIADPFGPPGARLYRTGDLVRWRADGQLDYLGRIDQQVKIRGFRIELGEIETQLLAQPEVQAAVVLVRSAAGGDRLVGYVVPQPGAAADAALLRERLAAQLPEYMVPAALVLLPALPLNANGKVDRKALPEPELATAQQAFEPPQGEVEQALATLWVEVLGLPQVGRADNFFALGGHSLLAIQLLERMRRQGWKVQVRELFQHPRLADFAKLVEPVSVDELAAPAPQVVGIPPGCESITPAMLPLVALQDSHLRLIESQVPGGAANIQDVYPLAPLQEGILFHHMMQAEGDVYVNAFLLGFDSRERLQAFVEALNQVVARHDILRTAVLWDGLPEPVQVVARRAELAIEWPLEGAATAGDEVAAQLTALVQARDFRIDVRRAPMMRLLAAQDAANQRWLLQLPSHHLALDHASEELLVEEIAQILQGRASQLPAPVPFRRFVAQAREAADPAEQTRFFKAMLADVTEPTAPFDLLDLQGDGASLAEARQMLAPALAQALRQQCRLAGIGAATLFHLAWALVLGKTTARDDVVFGTVLFGRMQGGEGAERALGLFINTLPLRVKLRGLGVAAALRQTHAALTELLHHEHASLSLAQRCSGVPAGTPLCATLLNYRHVTPAQADAAQEARTWQGIETLAFHESSNYPFGLSVNDQGEGFELIAQIDRRVSAQRICDDMQRAVQQLVQALATQPDQPLHTLALLSPLEQAQLQTWGRGDASGCDGRLVHQLVAEQAALRPDAVALIMGEQQLSYAELDTRANRLAHRLIAAGVAPEVRVGLALPRSLDMVVALLAVLKAGGAYVPLDANYPAERLAYMLADSGVALLLAHTRTQRGLPAPATLLLDTLDLADQPTHAPEVPLHGEHLAYVIYTSGSTGQPKGVAVAHGPLAMHVQTIGLAYGMRPEDRELQFASISFDGAHERIWVPLAFGSALMPRDEELWSVERTCEEIQRHGITVACFTPSYLHQMAELMGEAASRLPIRSYTVGGEAMPRTSLALVHAVLKPERVINGYGPTETVITPTIAKAERGENFDAAYMPIGRLVGDRTAHVLDAALRPLPPGVAGELYLGGSGLARGYLGRAGLSAERFVADPFSENGARLYRTGDLVRWRSNAAPRTGLPPGPPPKGDQELGSGPSFLDGQLEYLGRIDHQVKIRGFRIELGEVEAQLLAQPEVREAVAVALPGGAGLRLVAYVSLLPGQPVDGATLRSRLAELLPEHMLPSLTVVLPTLPLNLNGKVDRAALPAPAFEAAAEHAAPQGAAETTLATLWAEVLGVPRVGRHDNFFELGGDSILSLQIVARARERGWRLTPRQLFERQTVAQLAQVAEPVHAAGPAAVAALPGGWLPLLPIQADFFAQAAPSLHWNQAVLLQSRSALQPEPLRAALAALLRQHPSLRLRFGRSAEGVWQQRYAAADEADAAELLWLRQAADAAELQRHCDEAQRSISVQHGPLLRALAVQLPDASWRLLLAIHHLAVDGVSWRILLQDLETALRQQAAGQPVVLAPATSRYDEWVQALQARAADHGHELPHWLAQAEAAEPWSWPCARPQGRNRMADQASLSFTLSPATTQALLKQAPAAYRTQVNDLLLTALGRALCAAGGRSELQVDLEGHGREDLVPGLDLSRTVGWFTTVHPVRLAPLGEPGAALLRVKEALRQAPHKGLGHGLLRHFGTPAQRAALAAAPASPVLFNYLGQFDGSFDAEAPWTPAAESAGESVDPETPRPHEFSVHGQVFEGRLRLEVAYSRERHDPAAVQAWMQGFEQALEALVAHCCSGARGVSPSDFPLVRLTQPELDALPVPAARLQDLLPLSPMQQGLLFHSLYEQQGAAYVTQLRVDVTGLDVARFHAAWQTVLARHEVLRSGFLVGERPLQWVATEATLPLAQHDARELAEPTAALDAWASADLATNFDLASPPLMRLTLVQLAARRHHLIWTLHHLLLDGWSASRLMGEVLRLYEGQALAPTVAPTFARYRDYLAWLQARDAAADQRYWQERLAAVAEPTLLADALPHPAQPEAGQGRQLLDFGPEATQALLAATRAERITLNTLVQAAWALLLARHTGQSVAVFGATVAGRPAELPGAEQMLGLFINTLPVAVPLPAAQRVGDWLRALQAQNLASREHEHAPLYEIQRWAGRAGQPLFDTLLVFENYPVDQVLAEAAPGGLQFGDVAMQDDTHYPMTLSVHQGSTLTIALDHSRSHFSAAAAAALAAQLRHLVLTLAEAPEQVLGEVQALDAAARASWLQHGAGAACLASFEPVHQRVARQAALRPQAPALVFGEERLSHAELNQRANRLAHWLMAQGVRAEVTVGAALARSVDMVVAVLAILKAGGAYVPLDPAYPPDRLAHMVDDSGMALLLCHAAVRERLPVQAGCRVVEIESLRLGDEAGHDPQVQVHAGQLAYLMYTSGSTGKPKGVAMAHGPLADHVQVAEAFFGLRPEDRVLQFATLNFDGFVEQLYPALCVGAAVVLRGPDVWDAHAFHRALHRHGITVADLTTAYWFLLLQDFARLGLKDHGRLRLVHAGGEAMPPEGLAAWREAGLSHVALRNTYGPTEAAVTATVLDCAPYVQQALPVPARLPIGQALPGRQLYVVDAELNLAPPGAIGELCIGGELLARGYARRAGLSAERFVADPFATRGGRLYRTGDLVRWTETGALEYMGRSDHQLKIRGFRVELAEIEAQLLAQPGVREAVVVAQPAPTGARLLAYVSADEGTALHGEALRAALTGVLPDNMLPAAIAVLPALPLNANGKIDRHALPQLALAEAQAFEPPQGERECLLAALWQSLLGRPQVGRQDHFFALGGHSLLAVQLLGQLRRQGWQTDVRTLFQRPRLAELAAVLQPVGEVQVSPDAESAVPAGCSALTPAMLPLLALDDAQLRLIEAAVPGGARNVQDVYPLAPLQEGILFHHLMQETGDAYVTPCLLAFDSEARLLAFIASLNRVIARHDILRTVVLWEGLAAPVQVVQREATLALEWLAQGEGDAAERLNAAVDPARQRIDVRRAPMLRALAAQDAAGQRWLLQLPSHHLVLDHTTLALLIAEIAEVQQGREAALPAPVPFRRYVAQAVRAQDRAAQEAYFRRTLGDLDEPTAPFQLLDVRGDGTGIDELRLPLPAALAAQLRREAQRHGVSAAALFHLAWAMVLARCTGRHDVVFGTVLFGRLQGDAEVGRAMGLFINTLPLRLRLAGQDAPQALRQTHEALAELLRHEHASLALAQRCSGLPGGTPMFTALLNYRYGSPAAAEGVSAWQGVEMLGGEERTNYPFTLSVDDLVDQDGGFDLVAQVVRSVGAERICSLTVAALQGLADALTEGGSQRLAELALATQAEREALQRWGVAEPALPGAEPVHRLIERRVRAQPDAPAVVFGDTVLSYAALNRRANQLAHRLIAAGVRPDARVGVWMARSIEMVVALLAVMKAGGAYVPLDPEHPDERLAYMAEDSGISLLLSDRDVAPFAAGLPNWNLRTLDVAGELEEDPRPLLHGEHLAYVIYTSGSTGRPKGAANHHRALYNRLAWMQQAYALSPRDTVLQKTPFGFDVSVWEFFWPLMAGARLAVAAPGEHRDPARLVALIRQHGVSTLHFVPSMLQAFLAHEGVEACNEVLRRIVCSGEALPAEAQREVFRRLPGAVLYNLYGPTEAAIDVTHWTCREDGRGHVAIGRPIAGLRTLVLDADLNPSPPGVAGELYLGGVGLARGYLGKPALSAERFIADPLGADGERFYRTGDLARWREDGQLEYLGRTDHQVKIRGFRIELGEIEARLLAQPEVREAVVVARSGPGGARLLAYASLHAGQVADAALLRERLATGLPEYMVPASLTLLPQLPLNTNGKVDRKALPEPEASTAGALEAPVGEVEAAIAALWAEVLQRPRVGRHDNFFELGGDSILSLQIVSRAHRAGWRLTPRQLFERQTVALLAPVVQAVGQATELRREVQGRLPLLPFQAEFFAADIPARHHWNQAVLLASREALALGPLADALAALVRHHESLRLRFVADAHGHWQQAYAEQVDAGELLWHREAADAAALEAICNVAQASLDLTRGPLLRACAVALADGSWRLLLVLHHLVVDGVSWRVLLEDLQTAYAQCCAGQPVALPPATSSVKDWALALQAHAAQAGDELTHWLSLAGVPAALPCDHPDGRNTAADQASLQLRLDRAQTQALLRQAPAAYRTQVNDLLLTALGRALCTWSGHARVLVDLEGHGREALARAPALDLSRTVGWFTSLFPVALSPLGEPGEALKRVKEDLRRVPAHGLSHGVFKHLGSAAQREALQALPRAEVVFNYLGQLDGSFEADGGWQPAPESAGRVVDDAAPRFHPFSVDGQVLDGELSLTVSYSRARHEAASVQGWVDGFEQELLALIAHCTSGVRGITPSDLPLAGLDQAQLDAAALPLDRLVDLYPLSPMQQGMLFHSLVETGGSAYVAQLRLDIERLNPQRFHQAWQQAVQQHEVLRTGFVQLSGAPRQWVARSAELPMLLLDWRGRADLPQALDALAQTQHQGLALDQPVLMRLALVRVAEATHHLIWTHHHLLLDGWSSARLLAEVLQRYQGETPATPPSRYRDYIALLQSRDAAASEAYWRTQLARLPEPTLLADALPRPLAGLVPEGYGEIEAALDAPATARWLAFARQARVTPNTLVQAAWALLLARYTGQPEVAFGATVAGRPADLPGAEQMLGLFINTLPVITALPSGQRLGDWLRALQAQNLASREHEHTPLHEIQRWAGQGSRGLFDSIVVFENYPVGEMLARSADSGLVFHAPRSVDVSNYPMDVEVHLADTLMIKLIYQRQHFGQAQVQALSRHLFGLLQAMAEAGEGTLLREFSPLSAPEQAALLLQGRQAQGRAEPPAPRTAVHCLIEARARAQPQAIALVMGEQELSYAQLNARANRLSRCLRQAGLRPGARVGVAMERSLDTIAAMLAILKASAAYVPLDLAYPEERLAFMVQDSGVQAVLAHRQALPGLRLPAGVRRIELEALDLQAQPAHDLALPVHEHALAYVIYTSGSTGTPKGVAVSHGPLAMHCLATAEVYGMGPGSCELHFMSFSFDGAHERWLTALCVGAGLALRDNELWTAEQAYDALHRYGVTNAAFPPAYLGQLADWASTRNDAPPVELYVFGGEAMPKASYDKVRETLRPQVLINGYGPTETVVTPLIWKSDASEGFDCAYAPIGKPVGERAVYVCDAEMRLAPAGVVGELYIGGYGLARGYLGRQGLTAERFVADPFGNEGGRLYRTGDLVRWMADGNIEYIGRVDHQVKIRGFRIELGEIESRTREMPGVLDVAVVARDGTGGRRLVAYLVPMAGQDAGRLAARVQQQWREQLPDYMVPAQLVTLAALPRLVSGKLDRALLPEPELAQGRAVKPPSTPQARQLAAIWQEVLGVQAIGEDSNFFECGGDSLSSLKVLARMRALGDPALAFKLRDLMQRPTIASLLGLHSNAAQPNASPAGLQRLDAGGATASGEPLFCLHAGLGTVFDYRPLARHLQGQRPVYGIPSRMLGDPSHRDASLSQMAADYARMVQAQQPQGPLHLIGWSFGGTLAAAVAAVLEQAGRQVAFLGLVDPFIPASGEQSEVMDGDIRQALRDFAQLALPGQSELDPATLPATETLGDEATVAAWLDARIALLRASGVAGSAEAGDLNSLDGSELARVFSVALRLREIAAQADALVPVQCSVQSWWVAERPAADRAVLSAQLGRALAAEQALPVGHFGLLAHAGLLEGVAAALRERR